MRTMTSSLLTEVSAAVADGIAAADPARVAAGVRTGALADVRVSGPGFLELTVAPDAVWRRVADRAARADLGLPRGADVSLRPPGPSPARLPAPGPGRW